MYKDGYIIAGAGVVASLLIGWNILTHKPDIFETKLSEYTHKQCDTINIPYIKIYQSEFLKDDHIIKYEVAKVDNGYFFAYSIPTLVEKIFFHYDVKLIAVEHGFNYFILTNKKDSSVRLYMVVKNDNKKRLRIAYSDNDLIFNLFSIPQDASYANDTVITKIPLESFVSSWRFLDTITDSLVKARH